jgi:hypothetical protein
MFDAKIAARRERLNNNRTDLCGDSPNMTKAADLLRSIEAI